jgi:hypothetical protein
VPPSRRAFAVRAIDQSFSIGNPRFDKRADRFGMWVTMMVFPIFGTCADFCNHAPSASETPACLTTVAEFGAGCGVPSWAYFTVSSARYVELV